MRPIYQRAVPITVLPPGGFTSLPAQIGSAAPINPAHGVRPLEHPARLSRTVETPLPLVEPTNDSTLAIERPLEIPAEDPSAS